MVFGGPGEFRIFDVNHMNNDLVQLHATFCHMDGQEEHYYGSCQICCRDFRGCSIVRRGIQLLLDNGTIKVSSNKDDYRGINVMDDCLVETVSNDEYASAYEFFSLEEGLLSGNDSLMTRLYEVGMNVIVLCFNDSAPIEIEYCSKPVVAFVVICLPMLVPYESNKDVMYKYISTIL